MCELFLAEDPERRDSNGSRDSNRDSRGFDDSIVCQPPGGKPHLNKTPPITTQLLTYTCIISCHSYTIERSPNVKSARPRAAAIDLSKRGRSNKQGSPKLGGDRSRLGSSPSGSPRPSPSTSPKHSRSKSPRR